MARLLLALSGPSAIVATAAMIAIHVIIAVQLPHAPTRAVSLLSIALEAVIVLVLGYLYSMHLVAFMRHKLGGQTTVPFGMGVFASTLAAASSAATIISMNKVPERVRQASPNTAQDGFLIGSSVALGVSFGLQILFMTAHFLSSRAAGYPIPLCVDMDSDDGESASPSYVKSVRYSQTSPISTMTRGDSMTSGDRSYSSAEKSYFRSTGSIRSSGSKEVRPMSSKTKLLSLREKWRPGSLESRRTSVEDGYSLDEFPSFEHQADGLCTLPRPVFLETIPASPTDVSRSTSPALSDLEPPRMAHRSRSYSPVNRIRERNSSTPSIASSELHIHPLFRSDSPTPPPMATPGTNVLAAPQAGQVIPHRQSVRDLKRMRSGSLPGAPSPLSRQNSTDDFNLKKMKDEQAAIQGIQEIREEEELAARTAEASENHEVDPLPPIPDWILTAGSRNSLTDYNSRKLKVEGSD
ncbi:hypothetical protein HJFPF1_02929 [Paramyrothecium foliicola]|nr:hypothetical protein HJFPF1_02929 [Paramyrothecium foliicola]